MSELLASMTGSMACIAGGVMAVYISLGVPAEYLIAASLMAGSWCTSYFQNSLAPKQKVKYP